MSEPVIKCENVYKIFGANAEKMLKDSNGNVDARTFQENGCIVGVNNASFEVSKGEMLVVMGLSGSGKSTLLRCISRLTDATGGKIFIEGQDLLQLNNKDLIDLRRNKMGMVFQSFALLPHKTVVENIAFPLQIKGVKTEDSISKAMDMVKLVGLDGRENYFPWKIIFSPIKSNQLNHIHCFTYTIFSFDTFNLKWKSNILNNSFVRKQSKTLKNHSHFISSKINQVFVV